MESVTPILEFKKTCVSYTKQTMAVKYEVSGSENCVKIKDLSLMQINLLNQVIALNKDNTLGLKEVNDSVNKLVNAYKEKVKLDYIFKEPNKAYAYFALFQALGNRLIFNPHESVEDMRVFGAVATSWDTYYPEAERGKNLHNIAIEGMKTQRILQAKQQAIDIDASKVVVSEIIDVPLIDNHGNRRSLTELKGKVVLLDFHALYASFAVVAPAINWTLLFFDIFIKLI